MATATLQHDLITSNAAMATARGAEGLGSIEALYALHGQRIFRFVLMQVRDRDAAETLTQDTFVRAWGARDNFRGECSAATWLTRIALNLVRDHTRTNRFKFWKRAAETAVDAADMATHLPSPASSAEAGLVAREQLELVWATVGTLSERQRTVFLLRFVEEMELADIAEMTGLPISTVKTHLYRALAAVRGQHLPASGQTKSVDVKEVR
jgi:RNA polymerase sigma-70 factor (ECF subfamily)